MAIRAIYLSLPVVLHGYDGPGFLEFIEGKRRPLSKRLSFRYSVAEKKMQQIQKEFEKGEITKEKKTSQLYDIVNEDLYRNGFIKLSDLRVWTEEYAENVGRYLEKEVLSAIAESRRKAKGGLRMAIIGPTSANEGVIRELLKQGGYSGADRDGKNLFEISANGIEKTADGLHARKFDLAVNSATTRRSRLRADIITSSLNPKEVAFMAFSEEDRRCMDYLDGEGGTVLVYPSATKEFKEKTAEAFGPSMKPYVGAFRDVVRSLEEKG